MSSLIWKKWNLLVLDIENESIRGKVYLDIRLSNLIKRIKFQSFDFVCWIQ